MNNHIIDANDPNELSSKVTPEDETRRKFMTVARWAGRENDMRELFIKFDKLLKNCDNPDKIADIQKIGAVEVYKLLKICFNSLKSSNALIVPGLDSNEGELYVNNELVYRDK